MFGARYFGPRYFGSRYFGKVGLVVDGAYCGSYFGKRYFAQRYFATPEDWNPFNLTQTQGLTLAGILSTASGGLLYTAVFDIAQTAALGLNGTLNANGALTFEEDVFYVTPPLDIAQINATLSVAGDLVFSAPAPGIGRYNGSRYFGARYFGRRYFSPAVNFNLVQSQGIGLTATLNAAGGISTQIGVAQTAALGLTASLSLLGDTSYIEYVPPPANIGGGIYYQPRRPTLRVKKKKTLQELVEEFVDSASIDGLDEVVAKAQATASKDGVEAILAALTEADVPQSKLTPLRAKLERRRKELEEEEEAIARALLL